MATTLMGTLAACLDGNLLDMQCGVTITDGVNQKARVSITSLVSVEGPEVLAGSSIGKRVEVAVLLLSGHGGKPCPEPLLVMTGKIVDCTYTKAQGKDDLARQTFTVEAMDGFRSEGAR